MVWAGMENLSYSVIIADRMEERLSYNHSLTIAVQEGGTGCDVRWRRVRPRVSAKSGCTYGWRATATKILVKWRTPFCKSLAHCSTLVPFSKLTVDLESALASHAVNADILTTLYCDPP